MIGQKFRMLTVLAKAHKLPDGHTAWLCRCDCGKEVTIAGNHLRKSNGTMSCGCAKRTHGESHGEGLTPLYRVWLSMRERCNNPDCKSFTNYGGRGITVCPEWDDYLVFKADMGDRPKGRSLDRIDNSGPYSKANCRWATQQEQVWNTRVARWVEFNGERKVLSEWARYFGMTPGKLYGWLRKDERAGMERALRSKT